MLATPLELLRSSEVSSMDCYINFKDCLDKKIGHEVQPAGSILIEIAGLDIIILISDEFYVYVYESEISDTSEEMDTSSKTDCNK